MDRVIQKYQDASQTRQQTFDTLLDRIGMHLGRKEMQERAKDYLYGLLRPVERKNGWQLAEATGHAVPYRIQHLLDRARWDADAVRDEMRDYALE
jgi:SRSO17 transposase